MKTTRNFFSFFSYLGTAVFLLIGFWLMVGNLTGERFGFYSLILNFLGFCLIFLFHPEKPEQLINRIFAGCSAALFAAAYTCLLIIDLRALFLLVLLVIAGMLFIQQEKRRSEDLKRITLEQYLELLEQGTNQLRHFKHDYQNILLSISEYLQKDDLAGLKEYYRSNIQPTLGELDADALKIAKLANMEVPPIKSIFVNKILLAQAAGVEVSVEIPEPVRTLSADPITVVRILGILMDNAVEAGSAGSSGWLKVACFYDHGTCKIIIENTYEGFLPQLHVLQQSGFSTKQNHLGVGFSNLLELVAKSDNMYLETKIGKQVFTQILSIEGK